MNTEYLDMHKKVFNALLRVAHEILAEVMVYHCGIAPMEITSEHMYDELIKREIYELSEFARNAETLGVTICIENTDNHRSMGRTYGGSGSEIIPVAEAIGSKNLGILYDRGHGYISSKIMDYDYVQDIKNCKASCFGFSDIYLPPGVGEIPFYRVMPLLEEYAGVYIHKIYENYFEHIGSILKCADVRFKYPYFPSQKE